MTYKKLVNIINDIEKEDIEYISKSIDVIKNVSEEKHSFTMAVDPLILNDDWIRASVSKENIVSKENVV